MSAPRGPVRYERTPEEAREFAALLAEKRAALDPQFRTSHQVLGSRSTVGCVALEVTQRCNLDCTLCYLSDYSESVPDPPLGEIKRKAESIRRAFGAGTNVQITGGEPTLRRRDELVEIVRHVASLGLKPALFTNGIRATRELLSALRAAGLVDVAFHVDVTQERKGFDSERALNAVREEYLTRARGLGLALIFNTTVCEDNAREVPDLVRFFVRHAGELGMASFQLQADTGRGTLRGRAEEITLQGMRDAIDAACGTRLSWDALLIGHPACHGIAYALVAGGREVVDVFDDRAVVERFLADFGAVPLDRSDVLRSALRVARHVFVTQPAWVRAGGPFAARLAARALMAMARARSARLGKLSFFVQNFQDAARLDPERVRNCSFYVATREGAVSMCEHNARRDDYVIPANLVRGRDVLPSRPAVARVARGAMHRPLRRGA